MSLVGSSLFSAIHRRNFVSTNLSRDIPLDLNENVGTEVDGCLAYLLPEDRLRVASCVGKF